MSILPHPSLFSWQEVEATSEISRLTRLLDVLPDAELLAALEAGRARARIVATAPRTLSGADFNPPDAPGHARDASAHTQKALFRKSLGHFK